MKNSLKKTISIMLAVVLLLTAAPLSGFVGLEINLDWLDFSTKSSALAETGQCGDNTYWTFDESTGTLTISGTGSMYKEGAMYAMGYTRFENNQNIKKVIIENGVTDIMFWAFRGCNNLTIVEIAGSVISIDDAAFSGCTGLTSITIPESVKNISCSAFNNTGIYNNEDNWENGVFYIDKFLINATNTVSGKYIIKNETKVIASYAFRDCTGLTSITIPDSVTSIGGSAFSGCTGLVTITIPESVISIGNSAFSACTELTTVNYNAVECTKMGSYGNNNDYSVFLGCSKLKDINVKNGVKLIPDVAFYGCDGLSNITIPDSVISIGGYAFSNCSGLTSVNIPDSVTSIGSAAFFNCTGLTSVTIPDSVTSIGDSVFSGCTGLTNITIPDSVKSIGSAAFYNCTGLKIITIPESIERISSFAFGKCSELSVVNYNAVGCKSMSGVWDDISDMPINNCTNISELNIGNNVSSIPSGSFSGCSGLTSVTIPDSVTSIGGSAFKGCTGLTSITIGDSVTSIGGSAFYNCAGLTSVKIPDSVTSIGCDAFSNCTGLTSVTIGNSVTNIGSYENGYGYYGVGPVFSGCNLENVNYNAANCESAANAFSKSGLKKVVISENVKALPDKIFASCDDLQDVVFESDGYIDVSDSAFFDSANVVICCKENSYIHSYAQMNGIKYRLLDSLGEPTFTVKNDVLISYSGEQPDLFVRAASKIGYGAFSGNTSLRSVELAGDVTRIFNHAFKDCANLEKIIIPQSVTSIGDNTFDGCDNAVIWCYSGSYAESYAVSHSIPYKYINLQISENTVDLDENETAVLFASFNTDLSEEYDMVWTSDNPSVVTVTQDGKITAVGIGEATITATSSSGLYAKCVVKVTRADTPEETGSVKSVKIDDVKLNYKKSATLKPQITSDDGVTYTVKYESSNPKVATVDQNGKVTATKRGSGSATITCTVTDQYGNVVKDTCTVSVSLSFSQKIIVYLLFGWIWY